jgi:hypothetical protein
LWAQLRAQIYSASPFSTQIQINPPFLPWSKWDANKHLVHVLCTEAAKSLAEVSLPKASAAAIATLDGAIALHEEIAAEGTDLTDNTNSYQGTWRSALHDYLANSQDQIALFELL